MQEPVIICTKIGLSMWSCVQANMGLAARAANRVAALLHPILSLLGDMLYDGFIFLKSKH